MFTQEHIEDNKYYKVYMDIVHNSKMSNRVDDSSLYEKHHIFPKSFGGTDDEENLVNLTFREHFICHRLLVKFTKSVYKAKMIYALHIFFHFNYRRRGSHQSTNSRTYLHHKKLFRESMKHNTRGIKKEIFRFKHLDTGEEFVGTRHSFRNHSGLGPAEVGFLVNQTLGGPPMRYIKRWGIFLENAQCFSFELKRPPYKHRDKLLCPHCGKSAIKSNYNRWHGDNCVVINPEARHNNATQIRNLNKKEST